MDPSDFDDDDHTHPTDPAMRPAPASAGDGEKVTSVFNQMVRAVQQGDVAAFRGLHAADVADGVDEELFARNVARAREHRFRFTLRNVSLEGDVATVEFTIEPGDGAREHADVVQMVMVKEGDRWAIHDV